jgi:16S rRNA (cytosine967-C5)-methyltransferase
VTDRERALRILERVAKRKLAAHEAIAREPGIEHPDFVRTLIHGVLRWQLRLDHAIESLAKRRTTRIDRPVLLLLRLGTYQLWFTDVPAYACVSETTELASRVVPRAKSFVNAVMRRASERTIESLDPSGSSVGEVAARWSHPDWLVQRWTDTYGAERTVDICRANQELSWPDLLVNTRRWTRADAIETLRGRGLDADPSTLVENVIRLRSGTSAVADLLRDGRVYAMDEGSVAMTALVPDTVRTVLDLCAAPGGKSLALTLSGREVVSSDISLGRLASLKVSAQRIFGSSPRALVTNALQPAIRSSFDLVLVDAPCSATGTIRKNPEVRWRVTEEEIRSMAETQKAILDRALGLSKRFVLYVTCSLEPEENDRVIDEVLVTKGVAKRVSLDAFTPLALTRWLDGGVLRLTPESGTDGFTATLLAREL